VGNNEKNEENEKDSPLKIEENERDSPFYSFFSFLPTLNHKSRFSRSETLNKSEVSI